MKGNKKSNNVPSGNTKISNFFAKIPKEAVRNEFQSNKRKTVSTEESGVLSSVSNLPQKSRKSDSPNCKKVKCEDENYFPDNSNAHTGNFECFTVDSTNSFKVTTPEKSIKPSSSRKTPTPKKSFSKRDKTPDSKRRTPKKLFEKSPYKLDEFNVQVLEDFVKVSPSTSNKTIRLNGTPQKVPPGSVQKSIKQYISPSASERVGTPRNLKSLATNSPIKVQSPGVKTKLNFVEKVVSPKKLLNANMDNHLSDEDADILLDNLLLEDNLNNLFADDLSFEEPRHCKILNVTREPDETLLKLKCTKSRKIGMCRVQEFWSSSNYFKSGDIVLINAKKNYANQWIVNNESGWLVYEPDLLISCTSVTGSLYCKRNAVFSDRFRGFDPPNRAMIIGSITHTLLQHSLTEKLETRDQIEQFVSTLLQSRDTVKRLYECDLTLEEVQTELHAFIPKLVEFITEYLKSDPLHRPRPGNWQGRIAEISDIEENLWCPELGIKGKIDVTASTDSGVVMPLEVKTGRATVSLEHRGQVLMYIMMMNKFGYEVSSGLLLYLREGVLKEVTVTPQEKRDVMILRNELAYFLSRRLSKSPELPEPLNNRRACANCPYSTVCTSFMKYETHDLTHNKAIREVQKNATSHLSQTHLDYFVHWSHLLALEAGCNKDSKAIQEIYTLPPIKREAKGRCIINVKVTRASDKNSLFEHTFEKDNPQAFNLEAFDIVEGNYVVVSTDSRPAVACGFVTEVSSSQIHLVLDRNLNIKYKGRNFHLDTYDSNNTHTFNSTSLALLLENTQRAAELRDVIIDKKPPSFVQKLPSLVVKKGAPILRRLNHAQQRAVLKALCAKEFLLIKGMPGTGKSATIVALIQLLVELDKSVLITSHTHSAIDNICTRLQKFGVEFLRLGSEKKIATNLRQNTEAYLTEKCKTPEELAEVYNRFKVIAVTCLGSNHPVLSKRTVDVCVVDESTLVIQTSMIKCLNAAKKFVLIGDPDQLAPLVKSREAIEAGMSESLFERLANPEGTITLNLNYRMNRTITELANVLTYKGELQPASDTVAKRTLEIPNIKMITTSFNDHKWLLKALNTSLEAAVQFIDTGPVWKLPKTVTWALKNEKTERDSQNYINVHEVAIVVKLVKALLQGGLCNSDIGVIATYRSQVAQISSLLSETEIDISTVDQFQGLDKNVIIYSCTKSVDMEGISRKGARFELLEDRRRLTVAITRAKRKLLIVGDLSTLKNYETFATLTSALEANIIQFDSSWSILDDL